MEAVHRISRLCEGWQSRVQDSTREDHVQYTREFLRLLGWDEPAPVDIAPGKLGLAYMLRGNSQTTMLVQFVMPGLLEPPGTVVSRGLDYCACTRAIIPAIRQSTIDYALITDFYRSYLYDVRTDELVLYADSPDLFHREMARELTCSAVERGSLDDLRREPRSHLARQLRECCHRWTSMLATMPGGGEALADMLLDRLLLLRYMAEQDVIRGVGWSLRSKFKQLLDESVEGAEQADLGAKLGAIFDDLWKTWHAQMFQPLPQLQALLDSPGSAAVILRELAMMSRTKFAIGTILESFNYGEADEKARVRLVPEPDEDRELLLSRQTQATIDEARVDVDLLEEGYRSIFYWFDRMVETCQRVGLTQQSSAEQAPSANEEDLFSWSAMEAARPEAVRDAYQYVAENGLKVLYATPRQFRTARLLLYLHIVDRYRSARQRFTRFPDVERALVKRPAVSERDKKRLFGG